VQAVASLLGPIVARPLRQVRVDQLLDQVLAFPVRYVYKGCRHPRRDVRVVEKHQAAKQLAPPSRQGPVAQPEAGADVEIAGRELVKTASLVSEPQRKPVQAPAGPGGQMRPGNADGERQEPAVFHYPGGRLRFGVHARQARHTGEQADGSGEREHLEVYLARALQARQPDPAGNQYRTAGRVRRTAMRCSPASVTST